MGVWASRGHLEGIFSGSTGRRDDLSWFLLNRRRGVVVGTRSTQWLGVRKLLMGLKLSDILYIITLIAVGQI